MTRNKKKRVLFIMPTLEGGGAEKFFISVINHLPRQRYDITLLLLKRKGVYVDQIPSDVDVLTLKGDYEYPPRVIVNRFNYFLWFRWLVRKAVGNRHFDSVVSFIEGPCVYAHYVISRRNKSRNITWLHSDMFNHHWTYHFFKQPERERKAYKVMDCVVGVSSTAIDGFNRCIGHDYPTLILPNFVEVENIRAMASEAFVGRRKAKYVVCAVGRLAEIKRYDRLIEALALLRANGVDCEAWIVGTGEWRDHLERLCRDLHVEGFVTFRGFVNNPYSIMDAADIVVVSSDSEGDSLVVKEALTLGKPLVSTDIPSIREIIAGNAGLICDFNADSMANAIRKLLADETMRSQFSSNARTISERWSADSYMDKLISILDDDEPTC